MYDIYNKEKEEEYKWFKLKKGNKVWMVPVGYEEILDDKDQKYQKILDKALCKFDVNNTKQFRGLSKSKLTRRIVYLVTKTFIKILLDDLIYNHSIFYLNKKMKIGMSYIKYNKSKFRYHIHTGGYRHLLFINYWNNMGYRITLGEKYIRLINKLSAKGWHWDTKVENND